LTLQCPQVDPVLAIFADLNTEPLNLATDLEDEKVEAALDGILIDQSVVNEACRQGSTFPQRDGVVVGLFDEVGQTKSPLGDSVVRRDPGPLVERHDLIRE